MNRGFYNLVLDFIADANKSLCKILNVLDFEDSDDVDYLYDFVCNIKSLLSKFETQFVNYSLDEIEGE